MHRVLLPTQGALYREQGGAAFALRPPVCLLTGCPPRSIADLIGVGIALGMCGLVWGVRRHACKGPTPHSTVLAMVSEALTSLSIPF
jgi:hypothetical protein